MPLKDMGNNKKNQEDFFNSGDIHKETIKLPVLKKSLWSNRVFKYCIIGVAVVGLLIFFYYVGAKEDVKNQVATKPVVSSSTITSASITPSSVSSSSKNPSTSASVTQTPVKTIDEVAQNLKSFSTGPCKALIPNDWTGVSNAQGTGIDLYNSDKSQGAGWFIAPVLIALYGEPENAITTIMNQIGNSNYTFTSGEEDTGYGFVMRDFTAITSQGTNIRGKALYKKYPVDNSGYVLSYYAGMTRDDLWDQKGALALSTAISIRCTAQITPSSSDGFSSSSTVSDSNDKQSISDSWSEKAILGYENVHSPSTGEHYQVPTSSYSDTGLQGQDPGYYRTIDSVGTVERLEPGYGNY